MHSTKHMYKELVWPKILDWLGNIIIIVPIWFIGTLIYCISSHESFTNVIAILIGGILGFVLATLLFAMFFIFIAYRQIRRVKQFVRDFPTLSEACYSYQRFHSVDNTLIFFTDETWEKVLSTHRNR